MTKKIKYTKTELINKDCNCEFAASPIPPYISFCIHCNTWFFTDIEISANNTVKTISMNNTK